LVHLGKRPASDTDDREIDQRAGAEFLCVMLATRRSSKEVQPLPAHFVDLIDAML
jgi:hypothetical protein